MMNGKEVVFPPPLFTNTGHVNCYVFKRTVTNCNVNANCSGYGNPLARQAMDTYATGSELPFGFLPVGHENEGNGDEVDEFSTFIQNNISILS